MQPERISDREITSESLYRDRRDWLRRAAIAAGTVALSGLSYRRLNRAGGMAFETEPIAAFRPVGPGDIATGFDTDEERTPADRAINYNNFYEFTTDKESVSSVARGFILKPWTVTVLGLCRKPGDIDFERLLTIAPLEERVYRMRCVEAWSMVVPWVGLPLRSLLAHVEPTADAKYVAFETLLDQTRFPGQRGMALTWPYVEGLRLDEATHPLAILAVGLYGRMLPAQNGAPLRLIVPWKYGFKGIKSIVRITLTDLPPPCTWNRESPGEYGFYANVNPEVPHPRWSQATEQRLGESGRRPTLPFNGYANQVASLYAGLDLRTNY